MEIMEQDPQTPQEIDRVVKKYARRYDVLEQPVTRTTTALLIGGAAIAADCLGGFGVFTTMYGLGAAGQGALAARDIKRLREGQFVNSAGQTIRTNAWVYHALAAMEKKLDAAFRGATAIYRQPDARQRFRETVAEVQEDLNTLTKAFQIVSGGRYGAERYAFIVDQGYPGKRSPLSLDEALLLVPAAEAVSRDQPEPLHTPSAKPAKTILIETKIPIP
jgi:hypothetical protein